MVRRMWTGIRRIEEQVNFISIFALPIDDGNYVLDTNASGYAIGGILSQIQDGDEKVIWYASWLCEPTKKNYNITRRELLAVVYFLKFRHFFGERVFYFVQITELFNGWRRQLSQSGKKLSGLKRLNSILRLFLDQWQSIATQMVCHHYRTKG